MRKDLVLVGLLVITLTLMAVPLSQFVIDGLLAINISLAVVILMVAIYLKRPSDFSTFPSVILIGTAFRLALSIGTTRLILSDADAGQIIETFGDFVVGGSVAIGLVIFLIITVVQFLVITKGAERVAEVGARFALDAMPGKQMSIDAEVRAGNLDAEEGAQQRALLDKDSQFFGAMDGAMKFVKGDAIAGLIIICINLIGGVTVGITLHNLSFSEAVGIFSILTIGDGLVAQFPALLMSLCAGIMVTRVSNSQSTDLGNDISKELLTDPRVPIVAAAIIFLVGLIPGFPALFFSAISLFLLVSAVLLRRKLTHDAVVVKAAEGAPINTEKEPELSQIPREDPSALPMSDRFILSLSRSAIDGINLANLERDLLERFWALYSQRGVQFPRATIIEQEAASETANFTIYLDEVPLLNIVLEPEHVLLSPTDLEFYQDTYKNEHLEELNCRVLSGYWVPVAHVEELVELGVKLMDHEGIIGLVAFRIYEHNLGTLFSAAVLDSLLETMRKTDPTTMSLVEAEMTPPSLLKTFRNLVEDGVPLRPASLVLSSLYYWINNSESPTSLLLAEGMRASMKRQLCYSIAKASGVLGLALIDPAIEIAIRRGLSEMRQPIADAANEGIILEPEMIDTLLDKVRALEKEHKAGSYQVTIVVAADLRRRMRNFLAANDLHLPVLSPHEISPEISSFPIEVIDLAVGEEDDDLILMDAD